MEVVRWPGGGPVGGAPSVATLGVFDGVHRGHQEILAHLCLRAEALGATTAVVTFDRHPGAVLEGTPQPAITSLGHKISLFRAAGLDICVVVGFDAHVAAMAAEDFAREVFSRLLSARAVVIGSDCRFGRGGSGDVALCRRLGPKLGFAVDVVEPVEVDGVRVSSTAIREAIAAGDIDRAARLLNRPVSLYGTVVHGDARGRQLGFPTANLNPHNETVPPDGVYAGRLTGEAGTGSAVVSIGRRPTFCDSDGQRVVEVHIIGASTDLYGRDIEVQFLRKLREQRAFASADELVAQIRRDVEAARELE
jgi:riboflavin kinase/FMN adenylyltransferase